MLIVEVLQTHRISDVPVVSASGQLLGIVSEADLMHQAGTNGSARIGSKG